jgi:hypothetical protein
MQQHQDLLCIDNTHAGQITVGRLYTTKERYSDDHLNIADMDDGSDNGNYQSKYFKKLSDLSIQELIDVAKSLVGLDIESPSGNTFVVEKWKISNDSSRGSTLVREDVKRNEVSVYLDFSGKNVPIRDLAGHRILYPTTYTIVHLNEKYEATVTKTDVKVGCQTFPIEAVEAILKASKAL